MVKRKIKAPRLAKCDSTLTMVTDFDHIEAMVTLFLLDVPDARQASIWLNNFFADGWDFAGISNLERLVYGKEGSNLVALDARTMAAYGIGGTGAPACPDPSAPPALDALSPAVLQPAMTRAVSRGQDVPLPVYVRTPWGITKVDAVDLQSRYCTQEHFENGPRRENPLPVLLPELLPRGKR